MARTVRQHTRKTPTGGTTTVTQHSRRGGRKKKRQALLTPGHAWDLAKRARRASRRKKTTLAIVLGSLGLIEIVSWLTLSGLSLILVTAGVLALAVGSAAAGMAGIHR